MPSEYELFWTKSSYAVVGHSAKRPFPKLTYGALKEQGVKVFAVDPSSNDVSGDRAWRDLESLPEPVEAVVLEVPPEETRDWVEKAADAGVQKIWMHMRTDTEEALSLATKRGVDVLTGTCAVMYLKKGFSVHAIHRFFRKLAGNY